MAPPWSRLFKTIAVVVTCRAGLNLSVPGRAAKVIDYLVLHDADEPGAFRTAAGVTLLTPHRREQSFLQHVLRHRCIADAHERVTIEIVAVRIQRSEERRVGKEC